MCWANSGCNHEQTGQKCPWVCERCGHRLVGALGHGRPCQCPGQKNAVEVFLARELDGDANSPKE